MRAWLLLVPVVLSTGCAEGFESDAFEWPPQSLVAHALGTWENLRGSNTREAFLLSYDRGFRLFEVDLTLTADGELVCLHDGWEPYIGLSTPISNVTTAEFQSRSFAGRLTLLTFRELLPLMRDHPDAYVILDVKDDFRTSYERLVEDVRAFDPGLFSRLIVQLYQPGDLDVIDALEERGVHFASVALAIYRSTLTQADVERFVEETDVRVVSIPIHHLTSAYAEGLHARGARLIVHTINTTEEIAAAFAAGADGVVTDFGLPDGTGALPTDVYPPY